MVPTSLDELYQLYARDIDDGQLLQDLKSKIDSRHRLLSYRAPSGHSPRSMAGVGNGKLPIPLLSQIAEEDLTSASTSVASFHLSTNAARRPHLTTTAGMPPHRTLSDQDLFTRVNDYFANNESVLNSSSSSSSKPLSYSHFNFDQSLKQPLAKGYSLNSVSSESVDMPMHTSDPGNGENGPTRRKVHTISPSRDSPMVSSPTSYKNNKGKLRKQTQDIAAKAAQRRANLHHKQLMEDIGSGYAYEPIVSKENTANAFGLEVAGVKPKKTVTINDPATVHRCLAAYPSIISFSFVLFSRANSAVIYAVSIPIHLNCLETVRSLVASPLPTTTLFLS